MSEILGTDLTSKSLTGTGTFDELMAAINLHLEAQFDKGTILSTDYSKVYLGAMQTTLQQSIAFLLSKEKSGAEADLINKQISKLDAEILNIVKQGTLLDAQVASIQNETLLTTSRIALTDSQVLTEVKQREALDSTIALNAAKVLQIPIETDLITSKIVTEAASKLLVDAQVTRSTSQNTVDAQQILNLVQEASLTQGRISKTAGELNNVNASTTVNVAQEAKIRQDIVQSQEVVTNFTNERLKTVSETALITQQRLTNIAQATVLGHQSNKVVSETALMDAKTATESWQISVNGTLPAQVALYTKQAAGFDRDAEQKAAKLMIDTWNVRRSTDVGTVADVTNNLSDADVGSVVAILKNGVGA